MSIVQSAIDKIDQSSLEASGFGRLSVFTLSQNILSKVKKSSDYQSLTLVCKSFKASIHQTYFYKNYLLSISSEKLLAQYLEDSSLLLSRYKRLDLKDLSLSKSDLRMIGERCCLREVSLEWGATLSSKTLSYFFENNRKLKNINLTRCHKLDDDAMQSLAECRSVEVLRLTATSKYSCESFLKMLKNMPYLKELYINQCYFLNAETILKIFEHCPKLEKLDVSKLYALQDADIAAMLSLINSKPVCDEPFHLVLHELFLLKEENILSLIDLYPEIYISYIPHKELFDTQQAIRENDFIDFNEL